MSTHDALIAIVTHHPKHWLHTRTGAVHIVVWAGAQEVSAISDSGTWRGKPSQFVREFEAMP